jgi:hypothetical protein
MQRAMGACIAEDHGEERAYEWGLRTWLQRGAVLKIRPHPMQKNSRHWQLLLSADAGH